MTKENSVKIAIQKRGGKLFRTSSALMEKWWDFQVPAEAGVIRGKELSDIVLKPNDNKPPIAGELLLCSLESAIENIRDEMLDIAIVSNDALSEWQAAKRVMLKKKAGIFVHSAGTAKSNLMIGVSKTFLDPSSGRAKTWQDAVKFSYDHGLPIFTTFEKDLVEFLEDQDLPVPPIKVRGGTVEAQARLYRTAECPDGMPVIADLVERAIP